MKLKVKIETLAVEYYDIETGCMPIRITAGEKEYTDCFSCYWDPLPDLKQWLESIVQDVEQCSFTYDNEGQVITFDYKCLWLDRKKVCQFSVFWKDNNNSLLFKTLAETRQLVEAFYCSLINLYDSDEYNPREWEFKANNFI